jgi:nitrate reductase beta subunit
MPVPKLDKAQLLESEHQIGMVMDLNKCIGCQTCTVACKTLWTGNQGQAAMYWMNVETRPGAGYPRDILDMGGGWTPNGKQAVGGRLPSAADDGTVYHFNDEAVLFKGEQQRFQPNEEPLWGVNWDEDHGAGEFPNSYYFYVPRLCNHCTHPSCVAACPRNALYKRKQDGIVLLSQERCNGYRFCIQACPYKKIYWNHVAQVGQKCIFCYPRIDQGIPTACSTQCVGQVRFVGLVDDPKSPLYKLIHHWKVALPLLPQHGTEPNIYYIPPTSPEAVDDQGRPTGKRRVPMEYLKRLFGDEAAPALGRLEKELGKVRKGERSELMDLLNVMHYQDLFSLEQAPSNSDWFGAFSTSHALPVTVPQEGDD